MTTIFVNPEIALESLPAAEQVAWQRLHPRFVSCRQIQRLAVVVLMVIGAGVAAVLAVRGGATISVPVQTIATIIAALLGVLFLVWPAVDVPRRGYAVRDKDIVYCAGVVWRSVKVVPFNRVQHATTGSGPLERHFGLATLTIFTAGGSGGDLRIAGLGEDVAERLRVYVVSRLGDTEKPAGEADADDAG